MAEAPPSSWPDQMQIPGSFIIHEEEKEVSFVAIAKPVGALIPFD